VAFKDFFSQQSSDYAQYRPSYPELLFDWLTMAAPTTDSVWDCGTGNGQAAIALAERFDIVYATDPSAKQLESAFVHPKIKYSLGPAEKSGLDGNLVSLVTVAQAFHWFDREKFAEEVKRVCRPQGMLVVWCYAVCDVVPEVDIVIKRLYDDITGPYWDAARKVVDEGYAGLDMPFEEAHPPSFDMTMEWTVDQMLGYLGTWSATQKYLAAKGKDPISLIEKDLRAAWGSATRTVTWPLSVRGWEVG
jgi:SAM-dependent methyltransferase